MKTISNPILKGFNPDPSIVRVGDDYYIATSSFEWYPGVQIHHSKDLINWRLVSRPLSRKAQLDMRGAPDSCGVWAPCLSYSDGQFWLIYTDVKRFDGNFKDAHNYLTTCPTIDGEWSDPIYMNSSGFDPSLFHDEDGKKWFLNMVWDHRKNANFFGGILLQEYSVEKQALVGPVKNIFKGSGLGLTEAPHLYRRNGYYYLVTAEGGTEYEHVMIMARSKNIDGPYEVDPIGPFITTKHDPESPIQRSGHGDWVETQNGEFYAVHLCTRPYSPTSRYSPMGRETSIQKVEWNDDGWLRLSHGGVCPSVEVPAPDFPEQPWPEADARDDFEEPTLPSKYQWLRTPEPERLFSLNARKGHLRVYGRESLGSLYESALVACRPTDFSFDATCKVDFNPQHFQQLAGLTCYYNSHKFYYLYISRNDNGVKYLDIMSCQGNDDLMLTYPLDATVELPENVEIHLQARVRETELTFAWSIDGEDWQPVPAKLDYRVISDEAGNGAGENFTGSFVGMCCQDISGTVLHADFDYFEYKAQ